MSLIPRRIMLLFLFFLLLASMLSFVSPAAATPEVEEHVHMNLNIRTYADADGRIFMRQRRHYRNPTGEDVDVRDVVDIYDIDRYTIISKPDGFEISEETDWLVIDGSVSQSGAVFEVEMEVLTASLHGRKVDWFGESFEFTNTLYMASDEMVVPINILSVNIELNQNARRYMNSKMSVTESGTAYRIIVNPEHSAIPGPGVFWRLPDEYDDDYDVVSFGKREEFQTHPPKKEDVRHIKVHLQYHVPNMRLVYAAMFIAFLGAGLGGVLLFKRPY